jgi:hypothetical protein
VIVAATAAPSRPAVLQDPIGAAGVPVSAAIALMAASLAIIATTIMRTARGLSASNEADRDESTGLGPLRSIVLVASSVLWVVALPLLGFIVASAIALMSALLATRKPLDRALLIGAVAALTAFLLLDRVFEVALPHGFIDTLLRDVVPSRSELLVPTGGS